MRRHAHYIEDIYTKFYNLDLCLVINCSGNAVPVGQMKKAGGRCDNKSQSDQTYLQITPRHGNVKNITVLKEQNMFVENIWYLWNCCTHIYVMQCGNVTHFIKVLCEMCNFYVYRYLSRQNSSSRVISVFCGVSHASN